LLKEYSALIHELAPQVAQVISDGIDIAKLAVSGLITELFGNDNELQAKVDSIVARLEAKAEPMMDQENGEYFLSKDTIENAGDDFDREIEREIESLLTESGGHLMMLIGKMLIGGEDGAQDFEQKMEAFGERMELRGSELETRAQAMCAQAVLLDELETKMQKSIPQFSKYNLLSQEAI